MKRFFYTLLISLLFFISPSKTMAASSKKGSIVTIETTKGVITILLFENTPLHKANFISLIEKHYYDSILFHRVLKGFVIQAGDPQTKNLSTDRSLFGEESAPHTINSEIVKNMHHIRGAVGAAREPDDVNPEKRSSGSHFYIVHGNPQKTVRPEAIEMIEKKLGYQMTEDVKKAYTTTGGAIHLDGEYTIFGHVIQGMEVVDSITEVKCNAKGLPENEDIRIISMTSKELNYKKIDKICNKE